MTNENVTIFKALFLSSQTPRDTKKPVFKLYLVFATPPIPAIHLQLKHLADCEKKAVFLPLTQPL